MEKENGFVLFLKGVLVGIGNMIAGISGGTIAFITGIYEKMVYSLANLTKDFWPNFLYLIKIMLGVLVGLLGCAKVLNILFSHIILEMILLFTGVLLGGIYNHPYTRSLLSAIPLPDPAYEKRRQRITYNPLKEHDYSVDKPSLREIKPGHFVHCNEKEFQEYLKIIK